MSEIGKMDKPMSETQLSIILNDDDSRISQYAETLNQLRNVYDRLGALCQHWEGSDSKAGLAPSGEKLPPETAANTIRARFDKSTQLHELTIEGFNNMVSDIRNKLEILERIL